MNPTGMNEIPPNNLTIEQRGMSALALWAAATPPSYPVTQLPSRGKIGHGFTYWVRNAYPQPEAGGYWVKEFSEVDRLKNARARAKQHQNHCLRKRLTKIRVSQLYLYARRS